VTFLSTLNDFDIIEHFQSALGFILPNMDDFGIVAVEAMAAGTPVIAYKQGGALDYVVPGKTGVFFEKQTVRELVKALEVVQAKTFDHAAIAAQAQQFSAAHFQKHIQKIIEQSIKS
jgi:glycosyltransferase involved in cell wall biosynthesis